jgi:hypothetical protein
MEARILVANEKSVSSAPDEIATGVGAGASVEQVGLEGGIKSAWLARHLLVAILPLIVVGATWAAAMPRWVSATTQEVPSDQLTVALLSVADRREVCFTRFRLGSTETVSYKR